MEKGLDTKTIITQTIRTEFSAWENANLPYPETTIKELARRSGLSINDVLEAVVQGDVILPNHATAVIPAVAEIPSEQKISRIRAPKLSRFYSRTAAEIWSEGQRYQRRFHLDNANAKGKPTRKRIEGRVGQYQLANTKIVFQEPVVQEDRRAITKKKQEERALVRFGDKKEVSILERVSAVSTILEAFNVLPTVPISTIVRQKLLATVEKGYVDFLQFTCPPIDTDQLTSATPESYIVTSPKRNNFDPTAGRLQALVRKLEAVGIKSNITLIIGDTDEKDYLFPVIGSPDIDEKQAELRRKMYFENLSKDTKRKYPELDIAISRMSELQASANTANYAYTGVDESLVGEERTRMQEFFGEGNYYTGLVLPTPEELDAIARLKIKTYAQQGYVLSKLFPAGILLQNEFPLLIRSAMLLANNSTNPVGIIYPYGRSTSMY